MDKQSRIDLDGQTDIIRLEVSHKKCLYKELRVVFSIAQTDKKAQLYTHIIMKHLAKEEATLLHTV